MRKTLCKSDQFVRTLKYEHLEDRAMMAGNVCAAFTNGNLCITGDKCDNQICVRQCSDGKVEIRGLCGTKINGCECVTVCNVCAIKCDLKDGCDYVKIHDCCVRECICRLRRQWQRLYPSLRLRSGRHRHQRRQRRRRCVASRAATSLRFEAATARKTAMAAPRVQFAATPAPAAITCWSNACCGTCDIQCKLAPTRITASINRCDV